MKEEGTGVLITCDHKSGCQASYGSFEEVAIAEEMARSSGWLLCEDGTAYCPAHRAEAECPPLFPEPRIEYRDRVAYRTPDWVALVGTLWFAGSMVALGIILDLRSQVNVAEFRLSMQSQEDFEFKNGIKNAACDQGLPRLCSGLMITGPENIPNKPVRYSCDKDRCEFECK